MLLRPLRPEDAVLYPDFLKAISPEDRRRRFFAAINEFSDKDIAKFTHFDPHHAMAFITIDEDAVKMLGVVRLHEQHEERSAEFAIVLRSDLKGHGLGWIMMQRIIEYAKAKGLERVYGDVLSDNNTMLQMCAELGFRQIEMQQGVTRLALDMA